MPNADGRERYVVTHSTPCPPAKDQRYGYKVFDTRGRREVAFFHGIRAGRPGHVQGAIWDVHRRAHALADALEEGGAARERVLREMERGGGDVDWGEEWITHGCG